jgi:hypothetical protein
MYSHSFEVLTMPLTLNQVMGKHWRSRHSNFEKIKKEIAGKLVIPAKPLKKAAILIHRYSPGTLDRDNAFFTAKPVLDALVREGVLIDDGLDMVKRLTVEQVRVKRGAPRKLLVFVEEI